MYNFDLKSKIYIYTILYDNYGNGFPINSLVDTGSDITFITENLFKRFNFKEIGSGEMTTGNNTVSSVKLVDVNISLLNHPKYTFATVGVMPNKKGFDILIGMDIISYSNISINTNNTGFSFDIELPSCK